MGMSIAYLLEEIGKRLPSSRETRTAGHGSDGTSRWSAVTQQLKARFDSKDWIADDVRHITLLGKRDDAWSRMAVAWGIASIPGVHNHNVRALCAMIRCIDDMEPDQSVMVLERMDAGRSSNLVKMLREATDTVPSDAPNRVMAQCMVLAHIVDRLADSNNHFRLLTLNYRFELYLRILNQYARGFALVDPCEPPSPPSRQVDLEVTQNRGIWWSLVQTQAYRLFHIYQLGNMNIRGSISEGERLFLR
jgi:hypothetical protein